MPQSAAHLARFEPIHALALEYLSLSALLRRMAIGFLLGGTRTGLTYKRACPLIELPSRPEGDLRGRWQVGGRLHERATAGLIKRNTLRDKNNGGRPRTKSTRHLPESRSQNKNATNDLSGQRSEAAGDCYLV